ncbi:MAG: MMPL family transporter [Planctomycetota bacterium]
MRIGSDTVRLFVLTLVTALAAVGHGRLTVDRINRAMRSSSGPQAEADALEEAEFGGEEVLVLLLEPMRGFVPSREADHERREFVARLRGQDLVRSVARLPLKDPETMALAVSLDLARVHADGGTDRVRALVERARAEAPTLFHFHATGRLLGELAIADAMRAEQQRVVPILILALFGLLLLCYRHVGMALAVLLPAIAGVLWIGGLEYLLGLPLDPISSLLPPVLLTVGVAGSIHLLEAFLEARASGEAQAVAVGDAVRRLLVPASLTVATTVAGFLGLLFHPIPAVRRFGALAAAGVVLVCLLTLTWLPPWLRLFARSPALARRRPRKGAWAHVSGGAALFLGARGRGLLVVAAVVLALSGWEWRHIEVDTHPLHILPSSHPFRVDTDAVANVLEGVETFDLMLRPPHPRPTNGRLVALQRAVLADAGVVALVGPVERSAHDVRRLRFLLAPGGTRDHERLFDRVEAQARAGGWELAHAVGDSVRVARDSNALVRGQRRAMGSTLVFLFLAMAIGFRSLGLGLLGLIPNLIPSILLYGGLAAVARPMSVGSAMIGSVLLGLIVDDTIHFLHRYRQSRARGSSSRTAVARAFRVAGRALAISTLVQVLGFSTCLFGELDTSREFAVLAAGTMLVALLADLIVLPSILLLRRPA